MAGRIEKVPDTFFHFMTRLITSHFLSIANLPNHSLPTSGVPVNQLSFAAIFGIADIMFPLSLSASITDSKAADG